MNIFSYDGKLVQVLNRLTDLLLLNVLTIIGIIPLLCLMLILVGMLALSPLTILISLLSVFSGTFLTALHYCLIKMVRNEDAYTFRSFFKSCKDNLKQGSLIGSLFLVVFFVLWADTRIFSVMTDATQMQGAFNISTVMIVICYVIMAVVFMAFLYAFPLQARFENHIRATLKNALLMAILSFPRTLLMAAIHIAVLAILYFFSIQVMPFMILFGFSGPAYLCALLYSPVLKRFEPKEETLSDESDL